MFYSGFDSFKSRKLSPSKTEKYQNRYMLSLFVQKNNTAVIDILTGQLFYILICVFDSDAFAAWVKCVKASHDLRNKILWYP